MTYNPFSTPKTNYDYHRLIKIYNPKHYQVLQEIANENLCSLQLVNKTSNYFEYKIKTIGAYTKYVDDTYFAFLKWVKYESYKMK